jgi:chromosome partitioning protein
LKTICILNLKGGVAKTTTAVSMAELLANGFKCGGAVKKPQKVLLFDNDKQGNASRLFMAYQNEVEAQAAAVLKTATMNGKIKHTNNKNLDIVPCNYFMELAELEVKAQTDTPQHDRYRRALEELSQTPFYKKYDYCIIDNAPDLGMNVINALVAADEIVIPVNLDCYALDGLEELTAQVEIIRQLNRKAHFAGVLITDFEKTDTSEAAETWLRTKSGLPVFDAVIRHSKKVKDSTFYKQTPITYSVRSGAAQGYKKFTKEFLQHEAEREGRENGI